MAKLSGTKFLSISFFLLVHIYISLCEKLNVPCIKKEREALLKFKSSFINNLSNLRHPWIGGDCCTWEGVHCNKTSGHVIKLDLNDVNASSTGLERSLLALKHLSYLDLSMNDFRRSPIPSFIGFMTELKYLDLSFASFSGRVPPHLGNLTKLHFLGIGYNFLHADDHMEWIYNLSSLESLDMRTVDLRSAKALNLMKVLNSIPPLKYLYLSDCQLDANFLYAPSNSSRTPNPFQNVTSLELLHLSNNNFSGSVPTWFGNIRSLVLLYLDYNQFDSIEGGLLSIIRNMCDLQSLSLSNNNLRGNIIGISEGNFSSCLEYSLSSLDLGSNKLYGSLPIDWLGQLKNLWSLDLSNNQLNGSIPENLGQLQSLELLKIQQNSFEGVVSEVHFTNLSKLRALGMGNQPSINWKIKSDWIPPFHNLEFISLQYFSTDGSETPQWLRILKNLSYIDLSYNDITGTIPPWLGELSGLSYLDLSNNQIKGSIPKSFGGMFPKMKELYLAGNQIHGSLPPSLCKMENLTLLDVSENRLSGSIPNCWSSDFPLIAMSLSSNLLSGVIPNSLENFQRLEDLRLGNNRFHGEVPSFANCSSLKILDLGRNQLSGNITKLVGNDSKLQSLVILRLRENKFNGSIPSNLCQLPNLRILDFANNNIIGSIPPCLGHLPAMMGEIAEFEIALSMYSYFALSIDTEINVVQVIKGREFNYSKIGLKLFVNMDLSKNKMVGFIPVELTRLTGLIGLNLSQQFFRNDSRRDWEDEVTRIA